MRVRNIVYQLFAMLLLCFLWGCNSGNSVATTDSINSIQSGKLLMDASQFVALDTEHGSVVANSDNNSLYPSVVLKFQKPLNMGTVTQNSIKLIRVSDGSVVLLRDFATNNGLTALVISPALQLVSNTAYQIIVTTDVKSYDGTSLAVDFVATFTTGSVAQPTVALLEPNESSIGPNPLMQIIFSESDMKGVTPNFSVMLYIVNDSVWSPLQITTTAKNDNRIFTINRYPEDKPLVVGKEYYLVIGTSITDSTGAHLFLQKQFKIMATSSSDLSVDMINPVKDQQNVSINTLVDVVFNRAVNNTTGNILLHKGSLDGSLIDATVSTIDRQSFIIKPQNNLPTNTTIYVAVMNGIIDDSGAAVMPTSFSFTTSDSVTPETISAAIASPNLQESVPIETSFVLEFNESVNNVNPSTVKLINNNGESAAIDIKSYSAEKYLIIPKSFLSYSTKYSLTLSNQISDNKGNYLAATQFNFATEADNKSPIVKVMGLTGESYLSPRTNTYAVVIEFSEMVRNVTSSNLKIISASSCAKGGQTISDGKIEYLGDQSSTHPQYKIGVKKLVSNGQYHVCLTNITDYANNKVNPSDLSFNTNFIKSTHESAMNYTVGNVVESASSAVSALDAENGMLVVSGGMHDGAQKTDTYFLNIYQNGTLLGQPIIAKNTDSSKHYHISKVTIDSSRKKIYIIGYTYTSDTNHSLIYLARYNYSGNLEWTYASSPDKNYYHTDYRGFYQARGGFVDKSGNFYVVGGVNTENNDIDSFVIKFDANGNYKSNNRFFPYGDNACYANAAIAYDDTYFYITGTTQNTMDHSTRATKDQDDYEGFIIKADYANLNDSSIVQFAQEGYGNKGNVNPLDITIANINGCPYAAMAGSTKYPFNSAQGSYKYANGDITDAFVYYYPLKSGCTEIYNEFGSASGSTIATSIAYSPIKQTIALAGVTSGALSGYTKVSKPNNYDAFIAIKDINSANSGIYYPDSMKQYYPEDWYQYGATNYRTLQTISVGNNNQLFISGDNYNSGNTMKYYISETNQF